MRVALVLAVLVTLAECAGAAVLFLAGLWPLAALVLAGAFATGLVGARSWHRPDPPTTGYVERSESFY